MGDAGQADEPILTVTSHDEGRNAKVTLYPDRIERVKAHAFGALSLARQEIEMIPLRAVTSVQASKSGFRTTVTVSASDNDITFHLSHHEASEFQRAVLAQMVERSQPATAPPGLADQIRSLAALRDEGLLTQKEFEAKKRRLLGL